MGKLIYHPESDTLAFLPICFMTLKRNGKTVKAGVQFECFDMQSWIIIGDL